MPEFNLFRLSLLSLLLLIFSYFYFINQPGKSLRAAVPSIPAFVFNPAEWPSVQDVSTVLGYCPTPPPWNQMNFQIKELTFNFKQEASWNIQVNKESDLITACPPPDIKYNTQGSCWWSCGTEDIARPGLTGTNCHRPTDMTQCTKPKSWSLTFDDGPQPSSLDLLKILQQNNLKGTFFMVGSHMVQYPDIVRQLYNAGMELGVHTWSHHPLTTLSNDVIIAELMWTMKAFYDILGVVPKYFRPPMGDIDDRVRSIVSQLGLIPVLWDLDVADFTTDGHAELIPTVKSNFLKNSEISTLAATFPSGIITLEHDYFSGGVDLFSQLVLPQLKQSGFTVLNLHVCIGIQDWILIDTTTKTTTSTQATSSQTQTSTGPTGIKNNVTAQSTPTVVSKKTNSGTILVPSLLWLSIMTAFLI